ncbi:hypothetical protein [Pseudomonas segetis]|uniref:Uncharacterized protein n=1 Tax=Pseudomonas segetis TaxID=298908 RepID=A0A239CB93_9PSED|nr:hypothetical protein [Pseudomonas segetis]SNS16901.1 hypothetical protein SAMN05216255_1586 [Pseudomonas segetis]
MEELIEVRRKAFEREYGETEGVYFIPGLNCYGCKFIKYQPYADLKSSAWYHWQKALDSVVVELPSKARLDHSYNACLSECREAIHAAGIPTKVKA